MKFRVTITTYRTGTQFYRKVVYDSVEAVDHADAVQKVWEIESRVVEESGSKTEVEKAV